MAKKQYKLKVTTKINGEFKTAGDLVEYDTKKANELIKKGMLVDDKEITVVDGKDEIKSLKEELSKKDLEIKSLKEELSKKDNSKDLSGN